MAEECLCTPETYNKNVIRYMKNPKNWGKIRNPDAVGYDKSFCGDAMTMYIKVGKKKIKGKEVEYLKDIKFETTGCAGAVSTASAVTENTKGKPLSEAEKLTCGDVIKILGGLPQTKVHCCEMSVNTMKKAIAEWKKKGK